MGCDHTVLVYTFFAILCAFHWQHFHKKLESSSEEGGLVVLDTNKLIDQFICLSFYIITSWLCYSVRAVGKTTMVQKFSFIILLLSCIKC